MKENSTWNKIFKEMENSDREVTKKGPSEDKVKDLFKKE